MPEHSLQKEDLSAVFNRLRSIPANKLDTNWTWPQLRNMQLGGNANARIFFVQHNCTSNDAQQKYKSRAAQLYRDKLHNLSAQAMKIHGHKLFIDQDTGAANTQAPAELDFFDQYTDSGFNTQSAAPPAGANLNSPLSQLAQLSLTQKPPAAAAAATAAGVGAGDRAGSRGPSVDALLAPSSSCSTGVSPAAPAAAAGGGRRSLLGQKRAGGGGRRLGGGSMGAARVTGTSFQEIERQALQSAQLRAELSANKEKQEKATADDQAQQLASARLAYRDLGSCGPQQKSSDQLAALDPQKARQVERLGMGIDRDCTVSHSAFDNSADSEQSAGPAGSSQSGARSTALLADLMGPAGLLGASTRFGSGYGGDLGATNDDNDGFSFVRVDSEGGIDDLFATRASSQSGGAGRSAWSRDATDTSWDRPAASSPAAAAVVKSAPSRRPAPSTASDACGDEAQKKFGNAKAISSDAFFGNNRDTLESEQCAARFHGASSISSADYFGQSNSESARSERYIMQTPDMEDVKESLRVGVTRVAGKISDLASGVMSSIQDRY